MRRVRAIAGRNRVRQVDAAMVIEAMDARGMNHMASLIISFMSGFITVLIVAFIHDVRERKRLGLNKYFWQ